MIKKEHLTRLSMGLLLLFEVSCTSGVSSPQKISTADSVAAAQLQSEAYKLLLSAPDSALQLLNKQEAIHRRNHNAAGLMNCYYTALYIHSTVRLDTATTHKYADSAWALANSKGNECLRYKAYGGYGYYYSSKNNYAQSAEYYIKALKVQPNPIDSAFYLNATGNLAHILYYQQNVKAASDFYEPILRANEKKPASSMKVSTFLNGASFADKGSAEGRARAKRYLFAAKEIAGTLQDNTTTTLLFNNLASYYQELGMKDSSSYFAQKAIDSWKINPTYLDDPTEPFVILAQNYIEDQKISEAKQTLALLEKSVDTLAFQEINMEALYYDAKYRIAKQEGDLPAAFKALEQKARLNEQFSKIAKEQQTLKYTEDIKRLSAEKTIAIKNSQLEKQRIYTGSLIIVSLLLLLLAGAIYLYWRKQKILETEKWQHLRQKKEYESQMRLLEERARIAREMHDDLGSTLTSTLMAVELVKLSPGDSAPLQMIDRSANQLSDQINDIIWNMNIKNDNLRSLCDYIQRFASSFLKDASIRLSSKEDIPTQDTPVDGQLRRRIYLCVKELMNNIVKHSAATEVQLCIAYRGSTLQIDIADNGIGLNGMNSNTSGSGNGLENIKRSIEVLNGKVVWKSTDQGTSVQISTPLSINN